MPFYLIVLFCGHRFCRKSIVHPLVFPSTFMEQMSNTSRNSLYLLAALLLFTHWACLTCQPLYLAATVALNCLRLFLGHSLHFVCPCHPLHLSSLVRLNCSCLHPSPLNLLHYLLHLNQLLNLTEHHFHSCT